MSPVAVDAGKRWIRRASGGPTGQIFPQPQLPSGIWLDQQLGQHLAIIADDSFVSSASQLTLDAWQDWGVKILGIDGSEMQNWFNSHAVRAVILRPDRYILGVADHPAQMDAISQVFLNFSRNSHEAH